MSRAMVVNSLKRLGAMAFGTLPHVPVGTRCDAAEHIVRLRPPPEIGHLPAAQQMAGAAVADARGSLGVVVHGKGSTVPPLTSTDLLPREKFCCSRKISTIDAGWQP